MFLEYILRHWDVDSVDEYGGVVDLFASRCMSVVRHCRSTSEEYSDGIKSKKLVSGLVGDGAKWIWNLTQKVFGKT